MRRAGGPVFITGGGGQLASDLEVLIRDRERDRVVAAPPHAELDVTDDAAVDLIFKELKPVLVINCAAFHNVDVCEREEDEAFAVNARAVKRIAQRCAESGARLVHLSTNYVFGGDHDTPYTENDVPAPRNVYGLSKLAGEHAALAYCPSCLVVRSAGLYGLHGSGSKGGNFVTRMVGRARAGEHIRMVADQRLSPTFTVALATAILHAVDRKTTGLMHLTASGDCSWYEFTRAILETAGLETVIEPTVTTESALSARRPLNGVLARLAADVAGLPPLPHWRDQLVEYMRRAGLLSS